MDLKKNNAFTLVEVLVTAYILLIGICGILSLFINSMVSAESAWHTTVATSHMESILEEMQSKATLTDILDMDWEEWAQKRNIEPLPEEQFRVLIDDPTKDPLEIEVFDQWLEKSGQNTVSIKTKLTK